MSPSAVVTSRCPCDVMAEWRRREAIMAATRLTQALVDHLNVGVAQAYVKQQKLDHEVKTLQVQEAQFAKQTGQWITMVENFNQALKEIGDVENWVRSVEMDMRTIATTLEYVYKGQLQPPCS
ncbi:biogenesis of lysosome-related organelles complex 1 subunit 1-like [Pezoporus occidentalis]|uniref:biogenesis of lysosome-related organelles complex 1 subunit 1-like n=1 Tax=Pezoporus occidentalis TaxID=407982 RepID=UPI002F919C31